MSTLNEQILKWTGINVNKREFKNEIVPILRNLNNNQAISFRKKNDILFIIPSVDANGKKIYIEKYEMELEFFDDDDLKAQCQSIAYKYRLLNSLKFMNVYYTLYDAYKFIIYSKHTSLSFPELEDNVYPTVFTLHNFQKMNRKMHLFDNDNNSYFNILNKLLIYCDVMRQNNLFHRQLKSENIIVTKNNAPINILDLIDVKIINWYKSCILSTCHLLRFNGNPNNNGDAMIVDYYTSPYIVGLLLIDKNANKTVITNIMDCFQSRSETNAIIQSHYQKLMTTNSDDVFFNELSTMLLIPKVQNRILHLSDLWAVGITMYYLITNTFPVNIRGSEENINIGTGHVPVFYNKLQSINAHNIYTTLFRLIQNEYICKTIATLLWYSEPRQGKPKCFESINFIKYM